MTLKFRNMKKILYSAAIAAIMMTSCQKTDVLNVVGDLVEFGTEVGKLTKAGEGEDQTGTVTNPYDAEKFATLKEQGFKVWVVSDFTSDPHVAGEIYNSMNGLDVEYDTAWKYANGGKYMWPQAGQFLHFYTISSNDSTWLTKIKDQNMFLPAAASTSTSVTEVTMPDYTVDPAANDDIMVANHIRQDKTIKHVDPVFRHTMTKVEFNFVKGIPTANGASTATTVILKGLETSALKDKGTLKVTYSPAEVNFAWLDPTGATSFSKNGSDVLTIAKGSGSVITVSNEVPTGTSTEAGSVVVYTKDDSGNIISASVYETEATTVDNNPQYKWIETPETHTFSNGSWTGAEGNKYQTLTGFVLRTEEDIKKENPNAKFDNFATWYMIPQALTPASLGDDGNDEDLMRDTSGAVVTIHYIADGKHLSQNFNLNVGENDSEAKDWNEEHCVRYNVTIAPHKIDFKPIVGGWDTTNQVPKMNN